jgi:hypothetical protein
MLSIKNRGHYVWLMLLFLLPLSVLSQELLGQWGFNNDGTDYSGNGHDATLRGGAAYSDDAIGGSHSLLLNGSTAYASVGAIELGDQFTVCAWTFLEPGVTNIQTIFGNAMGGSTVDGFKLFINNWETSNKRIIIETADGTTRSDATSAENVFEEGLWNHVAASIDKVNGVAEIYYNGEVVTENAPIVSGLQTSDPITIGSMTGPDWFWNGMIDDVRIYQGILTIDDIDEIMNDPETRVGNRQAPLMPNTYRLGNYPNPFNPATTITFDVALGEHISLDIINVHGDRIRMLTNQHYTTGHYSIRWDALDDAGHPVSNGVYIARLNGERQTETIKMLLIK